MLRSYIFLLLVTLLPFLAQAQREGDNWVFGLNAGMRFMPDNSITFFSSKIYTREGSASISDAKTGELLFYTDGVQVWNRNHAPMLNGAGLLGSYSTAQSALIIPQPGSETRYYIFTSPHLNLTGAPFVVSEVDMTLDNGLGGIVLATKNTAIGSNATEKIIVARHCNKRHFWVIMRHENGNQFTVRLINESGLQPPQSFNLGGFVNDNTWNKANYMKLSEDQSLLVHPIGPAVLGGGSTLELFRFDNATGTITGPLFTLTGFKYAYATEFSKDNRLLYVSDISTQSSSEIYQFDISLGTGPAVQASKVQLFSSNRYDYGNLLMAPNGKIYVSKEDGYDKGATALDVIHAPSQPGTACMYQENGLPLPFGKSMIGLPNFPNYIYETRPTISAAKNCTTGAFQFIASAVDASANVLWNFGDPASGAANTASGSAAFHSFSNTGSFTVQAIITTPCSVDTLDTVLFLPGLLPDTTLCQGSSLTLFGPVPNTTWNNGPTGPAFTVSQAGQVVYQYTDSYGCTVSDSVQIIGTAPITTSEIVPFCQGDSLIVFGQVVTQSGSYSSTFSAVSGCDSIHTIQVVVGQDTINIDEHAQICRGDTFYLKNVPYAESGAYTLLDTTSGACIVRHRLFLLVHDLPDPAVSVTSSGCIGDATATIQLLHPEPGAQIRLNQGDWQSNAMFSGLTTGNYLLNIQDVNGCTATAHIEISGEQLYDLYAPNVFSPNDDGINDRFTLYGDKCIRQIKSLSVYDRWGGLVFYETKLSPGDESRGWDGTWRKANINPGVFVWIADVELSTGSVISMNGNVTVVR